MSAGRRRIAQEQIILTIAAAVFMLFSAIAIFGTLIDNMFTAGSVGGLSRTIGEYLLIGLDLTIVVMAGGIDLSIGSVFALADLMMLALGGTSLGGGRGSMVKTVLGVIIVVIITNSLIRLGLRSGASSLVLGVILLIAVAIDVLWLKNRAKLLARSYVSPTYFALPPLQPVSRNPASPYAINDLLLVAEPIGVGQVDEPEDVILDADGNLYCGSRDGDIIRFLAPDHTQREVYVHIGGQTLGLAFDRDGSLLACVGGMGLYKVSADRQIGKLSDETNRSWLSIVDESRMRLADDLDIAPDGRVFFSEATIRYEMHDWIIDALEGRGNGRIICYDPRDGTSRTVLAGRQFPNGICMVPGDPSFLFAETWGCRISRFWHDGPKQGRVESVIADLPGYPDNINLASDGNFWCGIIGMRAPAFDLAQKMPGFRRRMVMQIARDECLYPNMNTGGVVKFSLDGSIVQSLWDGIGERHPQVTSSAGGNSTLFVCIGSAQNGPAGWTRDLLQRGATGSVWSVAADGVATRTAGRLAWPSGAAVSQGTIAVAESWWHRLTQLDGTPVVTDLHGYPSRLTQAGDGWWLCVFAPRNQLIELVLREPACRDRMLAEVDPQWWVAPTLSPATSFYEPMQGGAIRTHGIVKPWAPTRSYGLLVRLDAAFRPIASYHSRADGRFHGITSALPFGDRVLVASRGGNAALSLTPVPA